MCFSGRDTSLKNDMEERKQVKERTRTSSHGNKSNSMKQITVRNVNPIVTVKETDIEKCLLTSEYCRSFQYLVDCPVLLSQATKKQQQ